MIRLFRIFGGIRYVFGSLLPHGERDRRRFLFSLTILSILVSKLVHFFAFLNQRESNDPDSNTSWLLFLPSFFAKDIIALAFVASALYPNEFSENTRRVFAFLRLQRLVGGCCMFICYPCRRLAPFFSALYFIFFGVLVPFISAFSASSEVWIYSYSGIMIIWREAPGMLSDAQSFGPQVKDLGFGDRFILSFLGLLIAARFEGEIARKLRLRRARKGGYGKVSEPVTDEELGRGEETDADKEGLLGTMSDDGYAYGQEESEDCHCSRGCAITGVFILVCVFSTALFRPVMEYDIVVNSVPAVLLDMIPGYELLGTGYGASANVNKFHLKTLGFPYPHLVSVKKTEEKKFRTSADYLTTFISNFNGGKIPAGFESFTKAREDAWHSWGKNSAANASEVAKDDKDPKSGLQMAPAGYDPSYDPLKIVNLDGDILPQLREETPPPNAVGSTKPLKDIKIRNILHIVLESTRGDVFPLREGNYFSDLLKMYRTKGTKYDKINGQTPFADHVIGKEIGKGGVGLIVHGAESQSSYSLKSHIYHFCGQQALPVGFNQEYKASMYRPCMPHLLKFVSEVTNKTSSESKKDDDWKSYPWTTDYMQTCRRDFDYQYKTMGQSGWDEDKGEVVTANTMEAAGAKHPAQKPKVHYMGYKEADMNPYLRDIIQNSKKNNKRFFAGIWTVATHGSYGMPPKEYWTPRTLTDKSGLNNYVNAASFQDKWLAEVIDILKEEGVHEETLVVMHGDHGAPQTGDTLPDKDVLVENPHHKCFGIPMVFYHPHLTATHIHSNATNLSVMPTILDLLLSTDSMPKSDSDDTRKIIESLLPLYEGQSLLRPLKYKTAGGLDDYRFSLPNNGGFMAVVGSSDPNNKLRFSVPLAKEFRYEASDLEKDPKEEKRIKAWTQTEFLREIEKKWGKQKKEWVERGIKVQEWWKIEMQRRWQHGDFNPKNKDKDSKDKKKGSR